MMNIARPRETLLIKFSDISNNRDCEAPATLDYAKLRSNELLDGGATDIELWCSVTAMIEPQFGTASEKTQLGEICRRDADIQSLTQTDLDDMRARALDELDGYLKATRGWTPA